MLTILCWGKAVFISIPPAQLAQQYQSCSHGLLSWKWHCLQWNTKAWVFFYAFLCDPESLLCTAKDTLFVLCWVMLVILLSCLSYWRQCPQEKARQEALSQHSVPVMILKSVPGTCSVLLTKTRAGLTDQSLHKHHFSLQEPFCGLFCGFLLVKVTCPLTCCLFKGK